MSEQRTDYILDLRQHNEPIVTIEVDGTVVLHKGGRFPDLAYLFWNSIASHGVTLTQRIERLQSELEKAHALVRHRDEINAVSFGAVERQRDNAQADVARAVRLLERCARHHVTSCSDQNVLDPLGKFSGVEACGCDRR